MNTFPRVDIWIIYARGRLSHLSVCYHAIFSWKLYLYIKDKMTSDFLKAYISFCFPALGLSWCIFLFCVIQFHLWNFLSVWLSPKISSCLAINLVRSFHQCLNLKTKLVSRAPVFIFLFENYYIPFFGVNGTHPYKSVLW